MQPQSQSSSQNDCYSTNEEYFLDICRFGEFDQIKEFLSTLSNDSHFDWEWVSNSGDNFVHMLAGNNFPDIFAYLAQEINHRGLKDKLPTLINKQNSTGQTPLHYSVITDSKDMLLKLLEHGADPSIKNQFNRTPLDEAEMMQKFQLAQILAPLTKPDLEQLKKQFGAVAINEDSDEDEDEEDKQKDEQDGQKDENKQKDEEDGQKDEQNCQTEQKE